MGGVATGGGAGHNIGMAVKIFLPLPLLPFDFILAPTICQSQPDLEKSLSYKGSE